MKISRFEDPAGFKKEIEEFLVQHEAENNLPLGILNGLIAGEFLENPPYLGYIDQKAQPQIAAICTPPFPVILSYQDPAPARAVQEMLLEDLIDFLGENFTGITGDKMLVESMKNAWERSSRKIARLNMSMRIYKLVDVIPPTAVPGRARPAREDDRASMKDFYAGFSRDAMDEEPDPDRVDQQVDKYLTMDPSHRGLWFWEDGGKLVSMAGYAGPTPNGIRIGAVYTPPDQRRKGYASAVTAAVSQHLLDQGYQFCFLFTDLLNPISNHIYQQIGYKPVSDVARYDFV